MSRRSMVLTLGFATLLCGALGATTLPPQSNAFSQEAAPEYDIKAALIHNFARFTEWPEQAPGLTADEFRFGVLGPDAALEAMHRVLKDKTVGGRRLKIMQGRAPADLKSCAMVFVADSEKDQIRAMVEAFKGLPILTVGETEGFAQDGGILNFRIDKKNVKFEINPDAAARAGLKVTKLVGVAPWKVKDR